MRRLELTGKVLDNGAIVISSAGTSKHGKTLWNCQCYCGTLFKALGAELGNGHTQSCGCYGRSGVFNLKHGQRRGGKQSEMYTLWININQRCHNPNHPHFDDYGERGIVMCDRWKVSFEDFCEDITQTIGMKPPAVEGYKRYWSLDRIDNNGNYVSGNIRWANPTEQKLNQRARRWWRRPKVESVQ